MIELQNVSKIFRNGAREVRALDDVSLRVATGEFAVLRGPSGCGKSTLLSLVGGLASPSAGTVRVADRNVGGMSAAERTQFRAETVGFVFQMFHLLPYVTVLENVLVAANGAGHDSRARAEELLNRFGLAERREHLPSQLSAGERQRVALARALLNRPKLLLADEPTGNLDPANAAAVLELLDGFHRDGGTVLLVTHDEHAAGHGQRTIRLRAGKLDKTE